MSENPHFRIRLWTHFSSCTLSTACFAFLSMVKAFSVDWDMSCEHGTGREKTALVSY